MNRYQNNNDEISVYVCRGDVCNRVSLDGGRGQGRVKENYDDQLNSIATQIDENTWAIKMHTIKRFLDKKTITIDKGVKLIIEYTAMLFVGNNATLINNGTIECLGFCDIKGNFINNGEVTISDSFQFSTVSYAYKGKSENNGVINCLKGSLYMQGEEIVYNAVSFRNNGKIIINYGCRFILNNVNLDNTDTISNNGTMEIGGEKNSGNAIINNSGTIDNHNIIKFLYNSEIYISGNNIINGSSARCMRLDEKIDCKINYSNN